MNNRCAQLLFERLDCARCGAVKFYTAQDWEEKKDGNCEGCGSAEILVETVWQRVPTPKETSLETRRALAGLLTATAGLFMRSKNVEETPVCSLCKGSGTLEIWRADKSYFVPCQICCAVPEREKHDGHY